jgi:hypothetical protein
MSTQIALCHLLELTTQNDSKYRFQNFFIGSSVDYEKQTYTFVPFGFSGVTFNRSGENSEATLVFPNKELIRKFVNTSVMQKWNATVLTCMVPDLDKKEVAVLYSYTAAVSGGVWKGESLGLNLTSILDAVSSNVPTRNMEVSQVGPLPISGVLNL